MGAALYFKVLGDLLPGNVNGSDILDGGRVLDRFIELVVDGVLDEVGQHAAQRLAGPRLRYHAASLNDTSQGCDAADLLPYSPLDLISQRCVWHCGRRVLRR